MTGRRPPPGPDRGRTPPWLPPAVLAAVGFCGLGALVQPFTWDQAVFALGAERLLAGGRLYVDYWDFKQPGIFWFFALGGRLFGMHEFGVHCLELAWMLALALVVQRVARHWLGGTASALAPLAVAGFYFQAAAAWHLLQVEGLVLLPLTLSFAGAWHGARSGRVRGWLAAGAAGGIALVFKLALAPLLVAIWLVPLATCLRRGGRPQSTRALLALATGTLVPVAGAVAVLAPHGGLALLWWTWVAYPAELLGRLHGLPWRNLAATGHWLLGEWLPLLVPAAFGAWSVLHSRADGFGWSLLAWLGAGTVVFLLQRWSGWEYQVFLVLVPLGLLAMRGLTTGFDFAQRRWPRARPGLGVVLGIACVLALSGALARTLEVVRTGALFDPAARRLLLARRSAGAYDYFEKVTAFLQSPDAAPGDIYVLGNPLSYWISGRMPAIAMPGGMSIYGAREWALIARELARAAPPYVLVEDPMAAAMREKQAVAHPLLEVLAKDYRPGARLGQAQWLVRRQP